MAIKRMLALVAASATLVGATTVASAQSPPIRSVRVASNLNLPTYVTHAPGDPTRLFILEKPGTIRILDLTTEPPSILPNAFLSITGLVGQGTSLNDERGLLGMAFHPNYPETPYFYVYYTGTSGQTVVRRFSVNPDNPNLASLAGMEVVITFAQPFANHNAGWIDFGPDGYLYIASGDGGSGNDPGNRAQQIVNQKLGKMLRLDIDGNDFPDDANRNYAIPPTNPFVGTTGDDEIWAYGLRNPWRCSFDRLTGDLWIADVGQTAREEINFQPATDANGAFGGRNYGWRCMEGLLCTGLTGCTCNSPALTLPVHQYVWGNQFGRSITGGYVYRGCQIPEIQGRYFFSDWVLPQLRSFVLNDQQDGIVDLQNWYSLINPSIDGQIVNQIVSFGEDAYGELYIVDHGGATTGQIFKIIRDPSNPLTDFEDCNENGIPDACEILGGVVEDSNGNGIPDECEVEACVGDLNGDAVVDGADLGILLENWGGRGVGDLNGDGVVDGADLGILLENWGACP